MCVFDGCSCSFFFICIVVVCYVFLVDIFQLGNLVFIQVVVFGFLILFFIVFVGGDVISNVVGVYVEILERCNEGSCVLIEVYFFIVCSLFVVVLQVGIDVYFLIVGVWYFKVFIVFVDLNWGGVYIEFGEE